MGMIEQAYLPSDDELEVLSTSEHHSDWGAHKFNGYVENLKLHLRKQQGNKCCYCKNELGFDLKQVDVEHILAKASYVQFMFEGRNLALSCPACNTSKGSKNVFMGKATPSVYPKNGSLFSIVHPHFDRYFDHIKIINNCLYAPLSTKGTVTIDVCKLYRLNKVMKNANQFKQTESEKMLNIVSEMSEEQIRTLRDLLLGPT